MPGTGEVKRQFEMKTQTPIDQGSAKPQPPPLQLEVISSGYVYTYIVTEAIGTQQIQGRMAPVRSTATRLNQLRVGMGMKWMIMK